MNEDFIYKGKRRKLIEEIISKGISDKNVLKAINTVPRHLFMDSGFIKFSYADKAFPIGAGQTISQPFTVAFQSQLLEIEKQSKVLEIGTGSGYQTAVLMEMGARVYTIERQKELYVKTMALLPELGYRPHFFYGDGYKGKPTYGPFDRILVTAGANGIPGDLVQQLKNGGRMVIPVGGKSGQTMTLVEKDKDGQIKISHHGAFSFVPMLDGKVE